ncbi:phenoloxidase 8-like [Ochlerotatus camptorhynchus]|uniref:phenoloxidase 8-like n=1 Tax=Ochlerotatus camptorhynchus TaxID=644619 RepID=UPI0031D1DAD2
MTDWKTGFLCLMTRPREPLFYPKYGGQTYMALPEHFLTDRYRPLAPMISKRFGSAPNHVVVKSIDPPDFTYALEIPRNGNYNTFSPKHRNISGKLVQDFMNAPDPEILLSMASYARDRLNPLLFQYALTVALLHRKDTHDVPVLSLLEMFPKRFVDPLLFPQLEEEGFVVDQPQRVAIEIPMVYSASEELLEQRLAYFREDLGINLHHWHWHITYPVEGPIEIVRKDRRGELFYYMHRQILVRYIAERFCHHMPPPTSLDNLREPIPEAYFPKLLNSALNRTFAGRAENAVITHVNRPNDEDSVATVLEIENWVNRFKEAVTNGYVLAEDGKHVPLDDATGIDLLGNVMENSLLSPNIPYYGNIHSMLHSIIGFVHDPDNLYLEGTGVIGDIATSIRDPIFYRLHTFVDDLFEDYLKKLAPYTSKQLGYPGVTIEDVSVQVSNGKAAVNRLLTFWQRSQVDLGVGLDFGPTGNVLATFTHLQHAPFVYRINVMNDSQKVRRGTVRIFLAPIYNGSGKAIQFNQQRRYVIELDKFTATLTPGINNIVRRSDESSVTIPFERAFRRQDIATMPGTESFRFCNCGWPDHMLIPQGSPHGMPYDLFVMVSDYRQDAVNVNFDEHVDCNDSHSYCGLRDQFYPDRRTMGFPFDRVVPKEINHMEDFARSFSNMKRTVVEIRFTNTTISKV